MKRHVQLPGVRKWAGDDLIELQSEGLAILDQFFAQYGNCLVQGCKVTGTSMSAGLVNIGGMVLPVAAVDGIEVFPVYLVRDEEHITREYADDVVRDIAVRHFAKAVYEQPADDNYIEISAEGAQTFFDKIQAGWLTSLQNLSENLVRSVEALARADASLQKAISDLSTSHAADKKTLTDKDAALQKSIDDLSKTHGTDQAALQKAIEDLSTAHAADKKTLTDKDAALQKAIEDLSTAHSSDKKSLTDKDAALQKAIDDLSKSLTDKTKNLQDQIDAISRTVSGLGSSDVPTLDATPTEDTLTYTKGEDTYDFKIGQMCRVYEDDDYVFYQLYDITAENKADWRLSGSGASAFSEVVKITLVSNQGVDSELNGKTVLIRYADQVVELVWNGSILEADVPMSVQYEVVPPTITGYTVPESQSFLAMGGNERTVEFPYSCEKITVNVSADDGVSTAGCTVTVSTPNGATVLASGKGPQFIARVPTGTSYKVSVGSFAGYTTPAERSFTASQVSRSVSFVYEKIRDAAIVFDKSVSDPSNITGEINSGVIATILSQFRRCLCKKTADGEVSIAYLRNDNSNYYEDGTAAKLDGTEGDVMVDFPEFYYKYEKIDNNKFRYRFAQYDVDGTFKHVPRSLVGAYKGYVSSNKLYSRSGVTPTTNKSTTNFDTYATARGTGYQRIDFQQHCVIAFMLYAKYGNRNLQAVLGAGGAKYNSNNTTGSTNSRGNQDTVNETANYVNGLGIEGVFGCIYEWVKGVTINNRVWTITDPDGSTRTVQAGTTDGWITNVAAENGPYFDMVPTAVGGSETTHYSDYYWQNSGSLVLARSYSDSSTNGGVAFAGASYDASSVRPRTAVRVSLSGASYAKRKALVRSKHSQCFDKNSGEAGDFTAKQSGYIGKLSKFVPR